MDFNIIVELPSDFVAMAVEIRLALGLEPLNSHLSLYGHFQMAELTDELDMELMEFFREFAPMELKIGGRMKWEAESGFLYYPVSVPSEFLALRQKLAEKLPPEVARPCSMPEYAPQVTLGTLPTLTRNQRDVVDNLYVPANWVMKRVQLEAETSPAKWVLEAGYSLGESL